MPILTPNNNPKNSAYRVCEATFQTICKEIVRGRDILKSLAPKTLKRTATSNSLDIGNLSIEENKTVKIE